MTAVGIVTGAGRGMFDRDGNQWRFADRLIYADLVGDLCFHIKGLPQ